VRFDERLQLTGDTLFTMHSLAVTALEETARLSRAASRRVSFGDRCARNEDEINSTHASSPDRFYTRGSASWLLRGGANESEIV